MKLLRKRRNLLRLFIDITVTDKSIMADVELKIYCLVIEVIQCMGDLLSKKSLKYRQKEVLNTVLFFSYIAERGVSKTLAKAKRKSK